MKSKTGAVEGNIEDAYTLNHQAVIVSNKVKITISRISVTKKTLFVIIAHQKHTIPSMWEIKLLKASTKGMYEIMLVTSLYGRLDRAIGPKYAKCRNPTIRLNGPKITNKAVLINTILVFEVMLALDLRKSDTHLALVFTTAVFVAGFANIIGIGFKK